MRQPRARRQAGGKWRSGKSKWGHPATVLAWEERAAAEGGPPPRQRGVMLGWVCVFFFLFFREGKIIIRHPLPAAVVGVGEPTAVRTGSRPCLASRLMQCLQQQPGHLHPSRFDSICPTAREHIDVHSWPFIRGSGLQRDGLDARSRNTPSCLPATVGCVFACLRACVLV